MSATAAWDRKLPANAATQAASQVTGCAPPSSCVRVQNTATASDVSATWRARLKVIFRTGERRWATIATTLPTSLPTRSATGEARKSPTTSGISLSEIVWP